MSARIASLSVVIALAGLCAGVPTHGQAADALPSWNDGAAKRSIIDFARRVSTQGGADFVPSSERIAVFDNDGTLWPENPLPFQLAFVLDQLKSRVPSDLATLLAGEHADGLMRIVSLTHAGMTVDDFDATVRAWLGSAKHPRYGKPYDQITYQPMQEVLAYLRANVFKTFIVSGGGADFMRVFTERLYGIPPEQVVGSTARTTFALRPSGPVLVKTMDSVFVDDKAGKPVGIHQFIGRRPIACFGNSDGDQAMLEYTTIANPRPSFGLLVRHDDGAREYVYDAHPRSSGKLVEALKEAAQRGWTVVSMKDDWKTVFPTAR